MVQALLENTLRSLATFADRMLDSKHWMFWTVLISTALSIFLSTPRKEVFACNAPEMQAVILKAEHPFTHYDYHPASHQSKLDFRLTVPLLAHALHLPPLGIKALEYLFGIGLLALSLSLAWRISGDKLIAFMSCIAISATVPGNMSFTDFMGVFDGVAVFFILLAMRFTRAPVVALCVFAASFTDERAFIAASFIAASIMLSKGKSWQELFRAAFSPACLAVPAAWVAYLAARFALQSELGLRIGNGGVSLSLAISQMNNLAIGLWTGLEGLWLPIALALAALLMAKRYSAAALLALPIAAIACVAFCVMDITRSLSYLLPAFFIALQILKETESYDFLKKTMLAAMLICILWPSYHAGGKDCIWWHSPPLPIQAARLLVAPSGN